MSFLKFESPDAGPRGGVILVLVGESGSGKTHSALRVARGFAGEGRPFVVLDTEEGRAKHYREKARPWIHAPFSAPWSSGRYVEAITQIEAEHTECEACVIDQATNEWSGEGGVLDYADAETLRIIAEAKARGKRSSGKGPAPWIAPKRAHRKFIEKLTHSRFGLLVVLLQEKQTTDWTDPNKPIKLPPGADQDPKFARIATVQLMLTEDGRYRWQKRVTEGLRACFPEKGGLLTEETGRQLRAWADGSAPREAPTAEDQIVEVLEEAESVAAQGTEALAAWWRMLSPAMKRAIETEKGRLKAVAIAEDVTAAAQGGTDGT